MIDNSLCPKDWSYDLWQACVGALANSQLSKIRHSLHEIQSLNKKLRGESFRLGIVRTFTIETQSDALNLAISLLGCNSKIKISDLNNIEQELLNPSSNLLMWKPDAILVLWRLEELIPLLTTNPKNFSIEENINHLDTVKKRISSLITGYFENYSAPLFLSTLPIPKVFDLLDIHNANGYRIAIKELNTTILKCASDNDRIYIFDFEDWAAQYGITAFDCKMDFFAGQPISANALGSFSVFLARTLRPLVLPSAKVLALDLDNVLWGGILGEDRISGLSIGNDFPGNVYLRIQQRALKLKHSGILLVLLSKNNLTDVEDAFLKLDMPLKLEDFATVKVDWNEKYLNLKEIAEDLNLGIDSFVFLDDQIFEQEQMKFNLPQVKVLQVTEDPLNILNAIENCWLFDSYSISKEDLLRNRDYTMQAQRKALKRSSSSPEDFLQTLGLKAIVSPVKEHNIGRVVQMLSKTNQFNLTTRRHPESKVRTFLSENRNILLTLSLSDRFSDQGIIGLIIALATGKKIHIDTFLLSCRAISRDAEQVLWATLLQNAEGNNYITLSAEYILSPKNSQVSNLFEKLGMKRINQDNDHAFYELQLPKKTEFPSWIKIIKE